MLSCLLRRKVSRVPSCACRVGFIRLKSTETYKVPSRDQILKSLACTGSEFDVLIIGGGATGAGAALDAAQRGLSVACIEREDFSSGTSSRSTKLIWGGKSIKRFKDDFRMVMNCHRERSFLLQEQPHLTKWLPIAVPLNRWLLYPPPFGFFPAIMGPLGLFPAFFKFYDALSGFSCPPSHIMTPKRARRKFPQLSNSEIKYCSIFYEGMHDDSRTNLAIAQTAAIEGACIANYCEAISLLRDANTSPSITDAGATATGGGGKVTGAKVRDAVTGKVFDIRAKSVLLCGGPFTDELRKMEDPTCKSAINGASGIHIVLPAYFAPENIGLVDMNTSDGRFMFFLPWKSHVVVGTTDHACTPTMRPIPDEAEIKWLLHEASKYLNPELRLRRQDVLSAWSGIRPLAIDPHAASTATASRDHVISHNPDSGIVFASGGKWTTFREMAEDAVDKVIAVTPELRSKKLLACRTLKTHFVGYEGYSSNLQGRLIQEYNVTSRVARRLARAYGGRAVEVILIAKQLAEEKQAELERLRKSGALSQDLSMNTDPEHLRMDLSPDELLAREFAGPEVLLVQDYPFIEAEVIFAVRHDWAVRPEDFLARRTRLAFLNKDAAMRAIPRVVQLMAQELKWDHARQSTEMQRCVEFMRHFGGSRPSRATESQVRLATRADLFDAFRKAKAVQDAGLNRDTLQLASEMLDHILSEEEAQDCLAFAVTFAEEHANDKAKANGDGNDKQQQAYMQRAAAEGLVSFEAFASWWNSERLNEGLSQLKESKKASAVDVQGSGTLFG